MNTQNKCDRIAEEFYKSQTKLNYRLFIDCLSFKKKRNEDIADCDVFYTAMREAHDAYIHEKEKCIDHF